MHATYFQNQTLSINHDRRHQYILTKYQRSPSIAINKYQHALNIYCAHSTDIQQMWHAPKHQSAHALKNISMCAKYQYAQIYQHEPNISIHQTCQHGSNPSGQNSLTVDTALRRNVFPPPLSSIVQVHLPSFAHLHACASTSS